uniref:Uncharacterized protein n=1 Tax=Sphaerodactylus townsendi TaxID=933632 RepID=A0ACB8FUZ9_9SAUR
MASEFPASHSTVFPDISPGSVRLNKVSDAKAIWKIDGTQDSLCTTGFEAQFTIEGNSYGAPCVFPFKYKNESYVECTTINSENLKPWCGTTDDVDKDSLTGYCPVKDDNDDFWTRDHLTGNQYQINSESALTWYEARKSCQQQNAELLSITELHEQAYLAGLTTDVNAEYWIGLNSLDLSSGWQWVGHQPFRYLNWAPGSPSPESEKICATMESQRGKWKNKECDNKLGYICKKDNSSSNVPVISSDNLKPVKCPGGWVPYLGHCYHLYKDLRTWNRALSACQKEDGDLASIHNIEEHSFVISQLDYKPTDTLWIGMNARKFERYFEWSDGTRVTYTKWMNGQPSYLQDSAANCVTMTGENGYWMDTFCQEEHGYICKRKPLENVTETEDANPGCKKGWKRHGLYCYLTEQTLRTFSEANKFCEGHQGSLVFIEHRYEQAYLTSLVGLRPEKYFWIGVSEIKGEGQFNWTNGHPVTFSHWNSRMPGQNHGCVAMRTGTAAGLWDVTSCEEKAAFICKQWAEGVTTTLAPTTPTPPPCPNGWSGFQTSSFCFKTFKEKKYKKRTWFEARDFCTEIGGDLVSIHSEEDENIIEKSTEDIWVGLSVLDSDIGYSWSDGSSIDFQKLHPWLNPFHREMNPFQYERPGHWFHWELSSTQSGECASISTRLFWKMSSCNSLHYWACQIKRGVSLKAEPNDTFDGSYKIIEDGWVKYEDNEYYFHNKTLPMAEARKVCKNLGGDLAVIASEKERTFLWKYNVFHEFNSNVFIGLIVGLDGKFGWMDGTPVTYAVWAPGEPNNDLELEECVEMYAKTGLWNDIYCSAERHFICERHNRSVRSTIAPTSPAPPGGCSEGWHLFNNKCYQIFGFNEEERKTWSASRIDCKNKGGTLATIPNRAVQAFLTMHLKNVPVDSWIGLYDLIQEGTFLWSDEQKVNYTNWVSGAPNSYRTWSTSSLDCVSMIKNPEKWAGNWKDRLCSIKYAYICQKDTDPAHSHSEATIPASGYITYGNSSYFSTKKTTWEEARKVCHSKNFELVSILDSYSHSFLWLRVLKYGEPIWIGLNSHVTDGNYIWVSNWKTGYTNWAPGEPKENQACVYLDHDGYWKTGTCNKNYSSLCEQYNGTPPTDIPQLPGRCPESQLKSHTAWIPFRAHCYTIIADSEPWSIAALRCLQLGSSLSSIEDFAEMNFLMEHIQHLNNGKYWIGLLQNVDGEWIWKDGTAVSFVNWNAGEPKNNTEENYYYNSISKTLCVTVSNDNGKWFTSRCLSQPIGYICKANKIIEAKSTTESPNKGAKKEAVSSSKHGIVVTVIVLGLLILTAAGIAGYVFYGKRHRQQQSMAGFENSVYRDNVVMLENNDPE